MEKRQKPNPFNSSCLQALLDIQTAMERLGMGLTDIRDIIADFKEKDSELRETADQINHAHEYPDKSIGFFQSARYDKIQEFYELPRAEQILFVLMCSIQDPRTGLVTVRKGVFADALHYTDTERKNMQKYLDDLTAKGFLRCIYRQTNKKPGEYKINQGVAWIGKQEKKELSKIHIPKFEAKYMIGKDTVIFADGTKMDSGTLKSIFDDKDVKETEQTEERKRASADQNTDSSESHSDSEPQEHSNQVEPKNQDISSSADNMQKISEILTPEEELMFSGTLKRNISRTQTSLFTKMPAGM